jgi:very-short-patch-repair endonuclease
MDEPRGLIRHQKVKPSKQRFARQLRQDMTPAERALWQELRGNRLGEVKFRRQQIIHGYIADFYCDSAGLIIELDGSIHDDQPEWDTERQQALEQYEFQIIRFRNEEVLHELPRVLTEIVRHLRPEQGVR